MDMSAAFLLTVSFQPTSDEKNLHSSSWECALALFTRNYKLLAPKKQMH